MVKAGVIFRRLQLLTTAALLLTFIVVILGAYTRLSDAGLGCPDWPGCYGRLWAPFSKMTPLAGEWAGVQVQPEKAWIEMIHRYFASSLGFLIVGIAFYSFRLRKTANIPRILPFLILALVILQGLLGKWSVTLKLWPWVVMAHLMGGLTTLSLLAWLRFSLYPEVKPPSVNRGWHRWAVVALVVLAVQILLGGWTSANYAALDCLDFPRCHGLWWPAWDPNAFKFFTVGLPGSPGEPLSAAGRITVHMCHRLGALITTAVVGGFTLAIYRNPVLRYLKNNALVCLLLLLLQLALGIANVLALLPLPVAVAHNAIAACLLLAVLSVTHALVDPKGDSHK
jgi:cytochrome c oxidase assembly protein subunit 15